MIRQIIKIDEAKCNGCGICVDACHEGAIELKEGKARLAREDYCDGLGDCLPACPADAITFEEREAPAYNEAAVLRAKQQQAGTSQLTHWPVQIKLVPVQAPYFDQADLLIAADCTAYAYGDFHNEFIRNRITLIGCPKLDEGDYSEKLSAIAANNNLKTITIVRMEVPCCGGIVRAVQQAIANSGKQIPLHIVTISTQGKKLGGQ